MCWIVCKRKTIWWRNWRSWQAGRRQPRLWGRQHVLRKSLLKHTLFGDFAKLIYICIEFAILPGLPSTFKGFLSNLTSILIPTRFPRLFFQVSEPISAFCRSGLILLFPTLCRIWGSVGVVPSPIPRREKKSRHHVIASSGLWSYRVARRRGGRTRRAARQARGAHLPSMEK